MKTIASVAILALFVMSITAPWVASAQPSGPSASGSYSVVLDDNLRKTVEFEASWDGQGATTGRMTFRDEARIEEQDPDGNGDRPEDPPSEFYMTADLDSLTIENNRAVMGGTVRESSHQSYIGKWVQLVVEDNGESEDKLTWCVCPPEATGWVPVDAEDPRDEGAYAQWWATDAELEDDRGVQSVNIIPGNRRSCTTFALSTYEFPGERGEGQIQILQ